MYLDISTSGNYPKTLVIRNHEGGMIWQVYIVQKEKEANMLSANATRNGFQAITLEDFREDLEETFPDWRETEGGKEIISEDIDLFHHQDKLPKEIQDTIERYVDSNSFTCNDCKALLNDLETKGYTFDYGLDCQPFNLRLNGK